MDMQREHDVLGVAHAPVQVGQLQPQGKAGQQHEQRAAQVAQEALLQRRGLAGHRLGVDVQAALQPLADPVRQRFAEEPAVTQTGLALAHLQRDVVGFAFHNPGGFGLDVDIDIGHQPNRAQHQQADRQVQPQRQHVMLAPPGEVLARQFAGLEQQQLERAPQCAFGAEVGAAELLQELTELGRLDVRFLPAFGAELRPRPGVRPAAVGAGQGRRGVGQEHGGGR